MMIVTVRTEWANGGWSVGRWATPVEDQRACRGCAERPAEHRLGRFENGAVSVGRRGCYGAAAEIARGRLAPPDPPVLRQPPQGRERGPGLEAQVDLVAVSGWSHGFLASFPAPAYLSASRLPRQRAASRHDLPHRVAVAVDTTWSAGFGYPTHMSVIAVLEWCGSSERLGSGTLATRLKDGNLGAFWRGGPEPAGPSAGRRRVHRGLPDRREPGGNAARCIDI
jgi:hypothetical protein